MAEILGLAKPTLDVGIVAHDVAGMRHFYGEVLGLPTRPSRPVQGGEMVATEVGTSTIKLWCLDSPPPGDGGGIDAAIGFRALTVVLPSLDAVVERLETAGLGIVERLSLGSVAVVRDADGNVLELLDGTGAEPTLAIGITVQAVDRMEAFFTEVLGFEAVIGHPPRDDAKGRIMQVGSTPVRVRSGDGDTPVHTGPIHDWAGIRYATAQVASLESAVAKLRERDVPFVVEPTDAGGLLLAFIADPDGNWWELIERR